MRHILYQPRPIGHFRLFHISGNLIFLAVSVGGQDTLWVADTAK